MGRKICALVDHMSTLPSRYIRSGYIYSPDVILCGWMGLKHQLTNKPFIRNGQVCRQMCVWRVIVLTSSVSLHTLIVWFHHTESSSGRKQYNTQKAPDYQVQQRITHTCMGWGCLGFRLLYWRPVSSDDKSIRLCNSSWGQHDWHRGDKDRVWAVMVQSRRICLPCSLAGSSCKHFKGHPETWGKTVSWKGWNWHEHFLTSLWEVSIY